ncbi:MAG: Flagellar biosynthesis protein FlhB [Firmicutes bacterium]|nr:Flagellar biosynthesis protein FlhB [Bacillota bacterium]MDI6704686.1 flagellar biosynthesis protein FlhB [Bacillota bacterium]
MEFYINLQLFAEEKTDKATPKKKKDVREKGHVAQSKEINSALVLIGCFSVLYLFSAFIFGEMRDSARYVFTLKVSDEMFSVEGVKLIFLRGATTFLKTVAPIAGTALGIGLLASYAQVGFLFTTKTLQPKLDKLNPVEGFKRIFSRKSLFQLVKSLIKVAVVSLLTYRYLVSKYNEIPRLLDMETEEITRFIGGTTVNVGLRAGFILLALAILDYFYQRYEFSRSIMMTKQELKEEYKQVEGNPQIKSKIKERQRQMSMRRMMSEVPKADVVITNPTHLAVALKYDPDVAQAPYVLAKGKDLIAQRIKEIAVDNNIQVVENVILARSLYQNTDIGEVIPSDLYQAVAEVLAFVYSLNKN